MKTHKRLHTLHRKLHRASLIVPIARREPGKRNGSPSLVMSMPKTQPQHRLSRKVSFVMPSRCEDCTCNTAAKQLIGERQIFA